MFRTGGGGGRGRKGRTYAGVVGLKESNLEAFVGEEALGLGEVDGGMVGGGMPVNSQHDCQTSAMIKGNKSHRPVGQEGNLFGRHLEY